MSEPRDLYFWGWETLADNELFSVTMDAHSSRISVFLHKAGAPGYQAWLTFRYPDWSQLLQLVTGFALSSPGGKSASSIGSIERLSDDDVALTIGSVTVCIPRDHFQHMWETLRLADERILKAGRFQEGSP